MADSDALEALGLPILKDRSQQAKELVHGFQFHDPKLYECIMILCDQIGSVTRAISPIVKVITSRTATAASLVPPTNLQGIIQGTFLRLSWVRPPLVGILSYELRKGNVDWDSSEFILRTQSTQVDVPPFSGTSEIYRVKTMNDEGAYSVDEITVNVLAILPGPVTITGQVIDNNVLLHWIQGIGSWTVDYYEIERDGTLQGIIKGTFISYFEVVSGTYEYTIITVDVAENRGVESSIELLVNQPPDYVLQDERTSDLSGTKTNALLESGPSLLVNIPTETWEDHFVTRTWLDPQDQIDDGYPIYIQPANLTGSYEEVIDFGVILSNVIAVIRFNTEQITAGTMGIVVKMATSNDDITYSAFTNGSSQFLAQLRYLKFRIEFTASVDTLLMRVSNLITTISVKRENDGGEETAVSTDVGGTQVNFNKDFKDIESVTATVKTPQEPYTVVVDFVDIPDPVGFKVFVFDSSGNRVTKTIEWKARGVV